jgi:hypothetical protein
LASGRVSADADGVEARITGNYGEVRQQTRSAMVVSFSGCAWSIANDPQAGVQDNSRNGSFIPSFGDTMYEKYRVSIGVA